MADPRKWPLASRPASRGGPGSASYEQKYGEGEGKGASDLPLDIKAFSPLDRTAPNAYQQLLKREAEVNKAQRILRNGRMKINPNDDERTIAGKMGSLTALGDAKDPKVGLITARNSQKEYVGFMSYKPSRSSIEVVNIGTDGTQKGTGRTLMNQLISIAAKENKSISIASVPSARGFYQRMGFTQSGYSDFSMTAEEARRRVGQ